MTNFYSPRINSLASDLGLKDKPNRRNCIGYLVMRAKSAKMRDLIVIYVFGV